MLLGVVVLGPIPLFSFGPKHRRIKLITKMPGCEGSSSCLSLHEIFISYWATVWATHRTTEATAQCRKRLLWIPLGPGLGKRKSRMEQERLPATMVYTYACMCQLTQSTTGGNRSHPIGTTDHFIPQQTPAWYTGHAALALPWGPSIPPSTHCEGNNHLRRR